MDNNVQDLRYLRTWEDLKNWVKNHREILDKLEQYPGVESEPKSGSYGKVWKIQGKDLVLKVTTDIQEMEFSKKLVNRNTSSFLKIHFVREIESRTLSGNRIPRVMYKIQEYCYEDPKLQERWVDELITDFINGMSYEEFDEKYKSNSSADEVYELLERLQEDLNIVLKVDIDDLDLHKSNIMRSKQGILKVVDF